MSGTVDSKYPNKWLAESSISGFRSFMEVFYERCNSVSMLLLEAMEISLNLPAGSFTAKCQQKAHELRLNHYPAVKQERISPEINRVWPHTDLGVITCLFQDTVGGLEIEDRTHRGTFRPIPPGRRGEMIVNISETMQRWSNGMVCSLWCAPVFITVWVLTLL